jgi:hypothetical protein
MGLAGRSDQKAHLRLLSPPEFFDKRRRLCYTGNDHDLSLIEDSVVAFI